MFFLFFFYQSDLDVLTETSKAKELYCCQIYRHYKGIAILC